MYSVELATNDNGIHVVYVNFSTIEEARAFINTLLFARNIERPVLWGPDGIRLDAYA